MSGLPVTDDYFSPPVNRHQARREFHETMLSVDVEKWQKELLEGGWKRRIVYGRERMNQWVAPSGNIYRGPYHAWRVMQSHIQWGGEP